MEMARVGLGDTTRMDGNGNGNGNGKRSRYSTLPANVDGALGVINRELELGAHRAVVFEELIRKIERLEQELAIQKGRLELFELDREWEEGRN